MDPVTRESVVRRYAPKIKIVALRLKAKLPQNVELNELLSAGSLGLLESLKKFRPELGIKFETYAENRIKGAMLDELRRMDWISRGARRRVRLLEEASRRVEHETGRPATVEQLQEATGLAMREVEQGLEAIQNQLLLSLEAIQESLVPCQAMTQENEPYQNAALQEVVGKVAKLIDELTPREKLVLSLYYAEELNMRETADVMGITEGRVSQLHSQALSKLKSKYVSRFGENHD